MTQYMKTIHWRPQGTGTCSSRYVCNYLLFAKAKSPMFLSLIMGTGITNGMRKADHVPQSIDEFMAYKLQTEAQIERLRGLVESLRGKYMGGGADEVDSLTKQLVALKKRFIILQEELRQYKQGAKRSQRDLAQSQQSAQLHLSHAKGLQMEVDQLSATVNRLTENKIELLHDQESLRQQCEALKEQNQRLQDNTQQELQTFEHDFQHLKECVKKGKQDLKSLETRYLSALHEKIKYAEQAKQSMERIPVLEDQLTFTQNQVETLQHQIQALESDLEETKTRELTLEELTSELQQLHAELASRQHRCEELEAETTQLRQQLKQIDGEKQKSSSKR